MARQERVRRPNLHSNRLILGKCYGCGADIPEYAQLCDDCAEKWLEAEQARENAVDEEFERIKAEHEAACQETLNRRYEEESAKQWETKRLSPEERGQTPDLWDIRHHPNPPQSLIDFLDRDQ